MKKILILTGVILCTSHAFGQVGINSAAPHSSNNLTLAPKDLKEQYKEILFKPNDNKPDYQHT
ncbi:hypothetical protein [Chryseobacterium oleae]|nr:hypothetical protein [Chryseobacterium oleae]